MNRRDLVLAIFLISLVVWLLAGNRTHLQLDPTASEQAGNPSDQEADFDFYVLSLSWSPSFCESKGRQASKQQCGEQGYGFIVHGLWPQFEHGYPQDCAIGQKHPVTRNLIRSVQDIMPSTGLIVHQWRKHGSCSGLEQDRYFTLLREAYDRITIPVKFREPSQRLEVDPSDIEQAFLDANRGLPHDAIAVTCDRRYLRDVRICMTRQLAFRSCAEVDRNSCRRKRTTMPSFDGQT